MGSVNLGDGTGRWKKCMGCGVWTNYDHLRYEPPSDEHPYGRDLCPICGKDHPKGETITICLEAE